MNWIRVAVGIADDPDIHRLADALGVNVAEAVGLVVGVLTRFPQHAPDGNIADIPASLVERWAGWTGERGAFATALRERFCNAEGVWESWEKHNGAAMRDAEAARKRAQEYRRRNAEQLLESTANGAPNGSGDGSLLRTNERTNQTTGWRKRGNAEPPAPFKTDPFCTKCGGGMGKRHETDTRLTIIHREDCPYA